MSQETRNSSLYKIGAIATLTGLSTHTIRAWERRHGMVLADRTDGGTRLYSETALQRLKLLKQLLNNGESISVLSDLTIEELNDRLEQFAAPVPHKDSYRTIRSQNGKLAVWGHSPFERKRYDKLEGSTLTIEYAAVLESDFMDYLQRNHENIGGCVVFADFLNPSVLETLIRVSKKYQNLLWVVVFNMASNSDLLQLMENRVQIVRGPLPEGILVNTLSLMLGTNMVEGQPTTETNTTISDPMFSQEQLLGLMNTGKSSSNDFSGHLSMLIQNLIVFEENCDSSATESTDQPLQSEVKKEVGRARNALEKALNHVCIAQGLTVKD